MCAGKASVMRGMIQLPGARRSVSPRAARLPLSRNNYGVRDTVCGAVPLLAAASRAIRIRPLWLNWNVKSPLWRRDFFCALFLLFPARIRRRSQWWTVPRVVDDEGAPRPVPLVEHVSPLERGLGTRVRSGLRLGAISSRQAPGKILSRRDAERSEMAQTSPRVRASARTLDIKRTVSPCSQ